MTPIISELEARYIVEARRDQIRENRLTSWPDFVKELRLDGIITRDVSFQTIRKVVEGKYYPHLTDLDGVPYVWDKLPVAGRKGRQPNPAKEYERIVARLTLVERMGASVDKLDYRFNDFESRLSLVESQLAQKQ